MTSKYIILIALVILGLILSFALEITNLVYYFLFLIIFGIIGYIYSYFFGVNPARIVEDIGTLVLLFVILYFVLIIWLKPENFVNNFVDFLKIFITNIPAIMLGDSAGSVVGSLTGEKNEP